MAQGGREQQPTSRWERLRRLDRSLIEAQHRPLERRQLLWARVTLALFPVAGVVMAVLFSPVYLFWIGAGVFQLLLMPRQRRREVFGLTSNEAAG